MADLGNFLAPGLELIPAVAQHLQCEAQLEIARACARARPTRELLDEIELLEEELERLDALLRDEMRHRWH